MRIVSWNIRAGGGKRAEKIFDQLMRWQPDVIALSEFRGTPASQTLAHKLGESGWPHQIQSTVKKEPAKNALLTASRYPLTKLKTRHAPALPYRWLLTRIDCDHPFVLGNMHIPNFNTGLKYPYHAQVLKMMGRWRLGPALFLGDTNSGKAYIDDATGIFWRREHNWMEGIEALRWVDAFRHLHEDKREYTWYSHRDNGFRLDQAFLNPALVPTLRTFRHAWGHNPEQPQRRDALSDHAAMILEIDLSLLPSPN